MDRRDKFYIGTSLVAHLLILAIFMLSGGGEGDGDKKGKGNSSGSNIVSIDFNEPVVDEEKIKIPNVELKKQLPKPKKKKKKDKTVKDCKYWFGGIGVTYDYRDESVVNAYDGYPAERAGITRGDIVTAANGGEIRGDVGTVVELKVVRNGEVFYVSVIREKICLGGP